MDYKFRIASRGLVHPWSASTVTGVEFAAWGRPGDPSTSIDWAILNGEPLGGTVIASGTGVALTNTFLFSNVFGYDVSTAAFTIAPLALASGTYWLELQNAINANGDLALWDMNGGPSNAWESLLGDVSGGCPYYSNGRCSNTFDIIGTVPEPMTLSLFGTGLAGALALRRRKKKAA